VLFGFFCNLSSPSLFPAVPCCSGLARIEKSAQKQAKSRRDGMWSEKWYASSTDPPLSANPQNLDQKLHTANLKTLNTGFYPNLQASSHLTCPHAACCMQVGAVQHQRVQYQEVQAQGGDLTCHLPLLFCALARWESTTPRGGRRRAYKTGRHNDQSWWEKWGEQFDGRGAVVKW